MSSLPQSPYDDTQQPQPSQPIPVGGIGLGAKEVEPGRSALTVEAPAIKEVGHEVELPPEVVSVGVKTIPTRVPVSPPAAKLGVVPAGYNVPPPSGKTVTLPLASDQISQGLKLGVVHSWRWLAEWCIRRIKQLRFLQYGHGHHAA